MDHLDKTRNDHSDFTQGELKDYLPDPMLMFQKWYQAAHEKQVPSPHAMVVSTVDTNGQPSSRVVYLKELLEEGLVFYTNYNSKKGKDLLENQKVSVLFFWEGTEQQIRIEGTVQKVESSLSDDYFASRPRGSQIGAWASEQSSEIDSRKALEKRVAEFEKKYPDKVPRPPHWGGYLIEPHYFEFWQGRLGRLHDRICYQKSHSEYKVSRICP